MTTISTAEVAKAKAQLDRMRSSLVSWLHYRTLNDKVAAGQARSRLPVALAKRVMVDERDWATEQKLATQLHVLLQAIMPDAMLPTPEVSTDPNVAVKLAQIAIAGESALAKPQGAGMPWIWPVAIVGGLLLAVTTVVTSMADVAKEKERIKCIEAGACTDYGFWLKAGGVALLIYVGWSHFGPVVKSYLPKGR